MSLSLCDSRGRPLPRSGPPERIVSLVPSDTYTLIELGAAERLVGRTRFCVAPAPAVDGIPEVGGPIDPDVEAIIELRPDLVLANRDDNRRPHVEALEQAGLRVHVSHPRSVQAGLEHAALLAELLPERREANQTVLQRARRAVQRCPPPTGAGVRTVVPIWRDPLMAVGAGTFAHDVLRLVGATNVLDQRSSATGYPRATPAEIGARAPELLLLPDEPYHFGDDEAQELRATLLAASPRSELAVRRCDGQDLFWYGLRFAEGLERLCATVGSRDRRD